MTGSLEKTEDAALVAAILAGEVRAWNALVDRYGQLIWSVGRTCGLPASEAEDLVQIVFTKVIESIEQLEDPASLGGWLLVIAKREAWRQAAQWRRHAAGPPTTLEDSGPDAEAIGLELERQQAVRRSFVLLGDRCRNFIQNLFSETEVPSYQSLADQFDITVNSVGPIRRRCLDELQRLLTEQFPGLFEESS